MDLWTQTWQYAALLGVTLAMVAYGSVAGLAARGRLSPTLSRPVSLLAWRRRQRTGVNRSVARVWGIFLGLWQVVPGFTLLSWWLDCPGAVRLECVAFFVVEAAWFMYLRQFMVPSPA